MSFAFWAVAAVMTLLALAFVLLPLLRRPVEAGPSEGDSNLAILRRRQAELAAERDSGVLSEETYQEARAELERELAQQLGSDSPARAEGGRWMVVAVALLVPLIAVPMYLRLGAGDQLTQVAALPADDDRAAQVRFIADNIGALEARMRAQPDAEPEGWLMLARSYMILQRFADAASAYAEARQRLPESPGLLTDSAEALAYAQDNRLIGEPRALLARALELDPGYPKALWLAGLGALQAEQTDEARALLERLVAQLPPGSEAAAEVNGLLAQIPGQPAPAAAAGPQLTVTVTLAPELAAQVSPEDTVFVIARAAEGPRAPLAAQRRQVRDLPLTLTLDDSMAMVEGMSISAFPQVVIEARVSRSGNAAVSSGDLRGISAPLATGADAELAVTIDEVVE